MNFMMPAMLLNSVGVVILMLNSQGGVDLSSVGWIQPFKDGAVLIGSLLLISFITRFGYKIATQVGCLLEILACLLMGTFDGVFSAYLFFVMAGVAFALLKIAIYSAVSLITDDKDEHAGIISLYEGGFMVSIFIANGLFAWMIHLQSWNSTFYIFALFATISLICTFFIHFDMPQLKRGKSDSSQYRKVLTLFSNPAVLLFLLLILCYPLIEQGVIDFLPTFQATVLDLSHAKSVLIASLLPVMIAAGRICFGFIAKYIELKKALIGTTILAILLLIISLVSAQMTHIHPSFSYIAMWLLPCLGFFIAPIYPSLNSSLLSSQPKDYQSAVTLLIMIFSAIGGSIGSVAMGYLFHYIGGIEAFSLYIVVLIIILFLLVPYFKLLQRSRV